jgi:hypothetical protein
MQTLACTADAGWNALGVNVLILDKDTCISGPCLDVLKIVVFGLYCPGIPLNFTGICSLKR